MVNVLATNVVPRGREYETIYIVRPDAGEEAAQKVASRVVDTIERLEGKLVEVQVWGRRRMAYAIKGYPKGLFIFIRYVGFAGLVEELERHFRMLDAVLKYQTVKVRDEVDVADVEIDPEQIKFLGMDFTEEPEEESSEANAEEGGAKGEGYLDYEPEPTAPDAKPEAAKPEATEEKAPEAAPEAAAPEAAPEAAEEKAPEAAPEAAEAAPEAAEEKAPEAAEEKAPEEPAKGEKEG